MGESKMKNEELRMKKNYDKWDRLNQKNNLPSSFGTKLLNVTEQFAGEE